MDRVCHFEIPYSDRDRAHQFYQGVFGWDISEVPDMSYSMVTTTPTDERMMPKEAGGVNGGMYERAENVSTTPVIVIQVESCEGRVKDIESAGGLLLVGPHEVGDFGIYAQVKDTEDNIIGIWQPLHCG